ncbi:hypothetical protein ACO2I3_06835 [Leptospira interrogans]
MTDVVAITAKIHSIVPTAFAAVPTAPAILDRRPAPVYAIPESWGPSVPVPGPLSDRVIAALRERFDARGHYPSPENWKALLSIASVIEAMADGQAKPVTYLSSAPVGAGKTETIIESIVQLCAEPRYNEWPPVGVIVFMHTLEQVERLALALRERGIPQKDIAIEIGLERENDDIRMLGRGYYYTIKKGERAGQEVWESEHGEARIVIATQQKLLHMVRMGWRRDFEGREGKGGLWTYPRSIPGPVWMSLPPQVRKDIEDGKIPMARPRRVRIWDEAILPSEPFVASLEDVRTLRDGLSTRGHTDAAKIIDEWMTELATEIGVTTVPFIWPDIRIDLELPDDALAAKLISMQGKELRVRPDWNGNMALAYDELLPQNFAPLLVCDASGSLRVMYQAWKLHRGGLRELESGGKRYDNLAIHHWDRPAGKYVHRRNEDMDELATGVASVLKHVPEDEQILFVVRKPDNDYRPIEKRIIAAVRALGFDPAKRIRFVTWGKHQGTNAFADIRHVVLVGVLQTSLSVTEAMLRGAGKMDAEMTLTDLQVQCARLGEAAHHVFQAAGRGKMRKMLGDQCPEGCTLWTVFCTTGPMSLPRALLSKCFPGAKIEDWRPFGTRLRGPRLKTDRYQQLADALLERLGTEEAIEFTLYDFPAIATANSLRKQIGHKDFKRWIEERGLRLEGPKSVNRDRGGSWTTVNVYTLRRGG